MKKLSLLWLFAALFVFVGCDDDNEKTKYALDLPTLEANTEYVGDIENPVETWDEYGTTYFYTTTTDKSKIFEFDCTSSVAYGVYGGFEFTNLTSGQNSAITKKGVKNQTYVTGNYNAYSSKEAAIRFKDNLDKSKSKEYTVKGIYVTNCYYAYNGMKNGDGYARKFEEGDWFKLTIYNLDKSKKVEVSLADGTNILEEWKWVDLTPLGETSGLKFELASSDVNEHGMKTASYFCIDGITIEEI